MMFIGTSRPGPTCAAALAPGASRNLTRNLMVAAPPSPPATSLLVWGPAAVGPDLPPVAPDLPPVAPDLPPVDPDLPLAAPEV